MDYEELRIRRLVIVDEADNERAVIAADDDGVALTMADSRGKLRFVAGLAESDITGAVMQLSLLDHAGRTRWAVGIRDNEPPYAVAFDEEGRALVFNEKSRPVAPR